MESFTRLIQKARQSLSKTFTIGVKTAEKKGSGIIKQSGKQVKNTEGQWGGEEVGQLD